MAIKYGRRKHRQSNIIYTFVTVVLICAIFLSLINYFYKNAEEEAYETLHVQTKQIKDDLILQLKSDRENLQTMANFAAKLYADGESYNIMLESFKPIGLIKNIGILTPDNMFVTKAGQIDLNGKISFWEEAKRGVYISGRIKDLTNPGLEIVRSAVPITNGGITVGILYGVIKLDALADKYGTMAEELSAQLFIYDLETGDFIVDSVRDNLGNVSELENRTYLDGFTYDMMMNSEKGYTSFISAYSGKPLYIHYSPVEDFGWQIMLARPDAQVFAKTHMISNILLMYFGLMFGLIILYLLFIMKNEKRRSLVVKYASKIRKLLLEVNQQQNNISEALREVAILSKSRSAYLVDADGSDYNYVQSAFAEKELKADERKYFLKQLFGYASDFQKIKNATVGVMCITPNNHLIKTNPDFYNFLVDHKIKEVSFAMIVDNNNHVSILGATNPYKSRMARTLLEDIAVCFSIAIYNMKHLHNTEIAATTDSLTGASNRVTYKRDLLQFDEEKPREFSCVYIDVNELHLINNRFGHAAGDEMLLYIANTLKEVFFGHNVYRMGGDEFLVFARNTSQDVIKKNIERFIELLKPMDYHVAIGMSYRTQNFNTEEMVREAEVRMYEAKAQYYQNKEEKSISKDKDKDYVQTETGIDEIDAMLSILKEHYNGIYRVTLNSDIAHRILMPAYLGYKEKEKCFSKLFAKYIEDTINPDFHRATMSFLNYDAIKRQLLDGKVPRITFKKVNGETVILSVYKLGDDSDVNNTLWVFAKDR